MDEATFTVEVPAGVEDGSTLRLADRGAAGQRGGPSGSLFVHLAVTPDPRFERQGDALHTTLTVGLAQAALGTEADVESLDGPQHVTLAPGTQHGHVERIRDHGVPHLRGRGRGDLFVHLLVATPTDLTPEQDQLLRQFADVARRGGGAARAGVARACSRACARPLADAGPGAAIARARRRVGPGLRRRPGASRPRRGGHASPRPGAAAAARRGGRGQRRARSLGPHGLAGRRGPGAARAPAARVDRGARRARAHRRLRAGQGRAPGVGGPEADRAGCRPHRAAAHRTQRGPLERCAWPRHGRAAAARGPGGGGAVPPGLAARGDRHRGLRRARVARPDPARWCWPS